MLQVAAALGDWCHRRQTQTVNSRIISILLIEPSRLFLSPCSLSFLGGVVTGELNPSNRKSQHTGVKVHKDSKHDFYRIKKEGAEGKEKKRTPNTKINKYEIVQEKLSDSQFQKLNACY